MSRFFLLSVLLSLLLSSVYGQCPGNGAEDRCVSVEGSSFTTSFGGVTVSLVSSFFTAAGAGCTVGAGSQITVGIPAGGTVYTITGFGTGTVTFGNTGVGLGIVNFNNLVITTAQGSTGVLNGPIVAATFTLTNSVITASVILTNVNSDSCSAISGDPQFVGTPVVSPTRYTVWMGRYTTLSQTRTCRSTLASYFSSPVSAPSLMVSL